MRLIALNELLEDTIFSKSKKTAIINEIDNLYFALVNYKTQEEAMKKEMFSYLNDIKVLPLEEFNDHDGEQELVNKRLEELKYLINLVLPEELEKLEKLNLNKKILIAKIEQLLEIYVYTHKDDLTKLKTLVDEIADKTIFRSFLGGNIEEVWRNLDYDDPFFIKKETFKST